MSAPTSLTMTMATNRPLATASLTTASKTNTTTSLASKNNNNDVRNDLIESKFNELSKRILDELKQTQYSKDFFLAIDSILNEPLAKSFTRDRGPSRTQAKYRKLSNKLRQQGHELQQLQIQVEASQHNSLNLAPQSQPQAQIQPKVRPKPSPLQQHTQLQRKDNNNLATEENNEKITRSQLKSVSLNHADVREDENGDNDADDDDEDDDDVTEYKLVTTAQPRPPNLNQRPRNPIVRSKTLSDATNINETYLGNKRHQQQQQQQPRSLLSTKDIVHLYKPSMNYSTSVLGNHRLSDDDEIIIIPTQSPSLISTSPDMNEQSIDDLSERFSISRTKSFWEKLSNSKGLHRGQK